MTFDPTGLRGTPYGAPLVPPLPVRMRRVEILTVVYETDRDAADALIPAPLALSAARAALHVYWMHDAEWFGVYGESAVHLPVVLPDGRPGTYSPFLVLGSDGAVAAGREHYGQPKKHGEVALAARGDLLVGTVARNGIDRDNLTAPEQLADRCEEERPRAVQGAGPFAVEHHEAVRRAGGVEQHGAALGRRFQLRDGDVIARLDVDGGRDRHRHEGRGRGIERTAIRDG